MTLCSQLLPVRGVGLFSASEDGSVRVSDLDRRKLVHDCRLHAGGPVHAVRPLLPMHAPVSCSVD
jgi:hypothetical protein